VVRENPRVLRRTKVGADEVFDIRTYFVLLVEQNTVIWQEENMRINMQIEPLIGFLVIGLVAGFLAERIMKGKGAGLVINMVVGVVGAFIGGSLPGFLKLFPHGLIGTLISATVGAVILLFLVGLAKIILFPHKSWWRKALERN
jgi:uncharacterized membrane protein YeaQ/YmgE (transglycosylase-associated protein family)